jgi:hypothetical protein
MDVAIMKEMEQNPSRTFVSEYLIQHVFIITYI